MGLNHYRGKCNEMIHVTNTDNGKTVTAKIRDLCESCGGSDRIGRLPAKCLFPRCWCQRCLFQTCRPAPSAWSVPRTKAYLMLNGVLWIKDSRFECAVGHQSSTFPYLFSLYLSDFHLHDFTHASESITRRPSSRSTATNHSTCTTYWYRLCFYLVYDTVFGSGSLLCISGPIRSSKCQNSDHIDYTRPWSNSGVRIRSLSDNWEALFTIKPDCRTT